MEGLNYWELKKFSLRKKYFAFVDTGGYLADQLFVKHKVRVDYGQEYAMPDCPYRVIMCSVAKRNVKEAVKAFSDLGNKMVLLGHTDYPEFCAELKERIAAFRDDHRTRK